MSNADEFYDLMIEAGPDQCVLWQHAVAGSGYGHVFWQGRVEYVHVLSCEYVHGQRPTGRRWEVRHSCRNRRCFNPHHIIWGTVAENQADRLRDGTDQYGERSPFAKLTARQVTDIRSRPGDRGVDLAREFGVQPITITRIRKGRTWQK